MKLIKLTSALTKSPIYFNPSLVIAIFEKTAGGSTCISYGHESEFYVAESVHEVLQMLAAKPATGEDSFA